MSNLTFFGTLSQKQNNTRLVNDTVRALAAIAEEYSGRAIFETRFGAADQLIAHLIFKHQLPIRVFVFDDRVSDSLLLNSVDHFGGNIEVSTQQNRAASAAFLARYPNAAIAYEQTPAGAPLSYLLSNFHLLVSPLRRDQLSAKDARLAHACAWDGDFQRTVYYPLLGWSAQQIQAYVDTHGIPYLPEAMLPTVAKPQAWWSRTAQLARSQWRQLGEGKVQQLPKEWPNVTAALGQVSLVP